jgi:hypothetical protein
MAKKQPKVGRIQTAKNKKKVQDALHDAVAIDNDVEYPCPIDKDPEPEQPKGLPFTQEIATDRLDAITVMDIGVAIGDNSPFTIADTKNDESTVPDLATDDDGMSNEDISRKKPSRPMVPEPQVPKPTTRK